MLWNIKERSDVLWNYLDLSAAVTDQKMRFLATQYCRDVDEESFVVDMRHLLILEKRNCFH